jgi:hypothetical protein
MKKYMPFHIIVTVKSALTCCFASDILEHTSTCLHITMEQVNSLLEKLREHLDAVPQAQQIEDVS